MSIDRERPESANADKPGRNALAGLAVGFVLGLFIPQSAGERNRLANYAPVVIARAKTRARDFVEQTLARGLPG